MIGKDDPGVLRSLLPDCRPGSFRAGLMVSPDILSPEGKNDMTRKDKIARRKLSLLDLAAELSNVSSCKVMGCSRQQF